MKEKKMNDLKLYGQEHILSFINELNDNEKNELYADINKIDFKLMNSIYKNSFTDEKIDINDYSPCNSVYGTRLSDISDSTHMVKNGEYAITLMAGGNGSRLGFNGPKGCVLVGNKSLFQIYIDKLLDIYRKYGVYINLYIMTSSLNNNATINFFKFNNYFGYNKRNIKFFIQDDLPILDKSGKILLRNKNHILFGPNGNGNVFSALKKSNLLNDMKMKGIKYVLFMGIDNPLVNMVDFNLLEIMIKENYGVVTKTILKKDDNDMGGVFCKYKGSPSIIMKENMTKEINNIKMNGEYVFRDTNILYHVISYDNLVKFSNIKLRYHKAFKKNNYMDLSGKYITPLEPNSYKFEQFIYDAFLYADDMLLYRVDESEFMPIKNKDDLDNANKYFEMEW